MEWELALLASRLRLGGLVALVARIKVSLEHVLAVGDRPGVHRPRLHQAHREALRRARGAKLVRSPRQDDIVEPASCDQRARNRQTEAHRQRDRLVVVVVLGDDLPHVRARRRLERAHVAPAEVHAVVANVAAAVEVRSVDHAVAAAHGQLTFLSRVADGHDDLVDVQLACQDFLLTRRVALVDLDRLDRMGQGVRQLAGAVL